MNALEQIGLSKTAFRDVDPDTLDAERDAAFIIQKVAERGLWDDFVHAVKWYGKDRYKQEIMKASYLSKRVMHFICQLFGLTPQDFPCYIRRQSLPSFWEY